MRFNLIYKDFLSIFVLLNKHEKRWLLKTQLRQQIIYHSKVQ